MKTLAAKMSLRMTSSPPEEQRMFVILRGYELISSCTFFLFYDGRTQGKE